MPGEDKLRSKVIRLASTLPKGSPERKALLAVLQGKRASKRLSRLTAEDAAVAYDALYPDEDPAKTDPSRFREDLAEKIIQKNIQEHKRIIWSRASKVIDAVLADDLSAFRNEASLSRTNWYGKVTKALMTAVGVRNARNLNDLYEKFQAVK